MIIITPRNEIMLEPYRYESVSDFILTTDMLLTQPVDPHVIEEFMPTKNNPSDSSAAPAGVEDLAIKEIGQKHPLSKFEYDLYHEEDDVTLPVIRVKRISTSNKVEKWKIFEDTKAVFVVEGAKLNNKEKEFLRTPDGFNFLIAQYKRGIKSFNSLKIAIKKRLK